MAGNPIVGMRMTPDTIARLDRLAEAHGITRGQLVQRALEALPDWPDAVTPRQLPGQTAMNGIQNAQK